MDRRRLILLGLVIIAAAGAVGVYFLTQPSEEAVDVPEDQLVTEMVEIAIAANNLTQGMEITERTIQWWEWPMDALPATYFTDATQLLGYYVKVDLIPQGMPLMHSMLVPSLSEVELEGGMLAQTIPPGKRAYAIPIDLLGAVAWTLEPGDYVDVLVSWNIIDLDEEFQTELPNQFVCMGEDETCQGIFGRMELLPTGQTVMVYPTTAAEAAYVAQVTIQDAQVFAVGEYQPVEPAPAEGEVSRPSGEVVGEPPSGDETTGEEVAPAVPAPQAVQVVILIVDPQDALVLKAVTELQADIDLVLRAAGDRQIVTTDAVSLEYLLTRYGISVPPKLPYTVGAPESSPLEEEIRVEQPQEETGSPPE
jgi:Flp pilus assembly protein CpaB